jgi:hypothetical protein
VSISEPQSPGSHPETERFLRALRAEFPRFRIVSKARSPLSLVIDIALKLVTLGGQRHYLTRYHTVIGDTLYVPDAWTAMTDEARVILLRHERIHLIQRRRYGFPLFAFLYLVPFLPLGLAYGRARLEWEAYRETLRATAELRGRDALRAPELREEIVRRFTGPDYGWMWPFPRRVHRWFDQALEELEPIFDADRRS